jgi:hypothetical protein
MRRRSGARQPLDSEGDQASTSHSILRRQRLTTNPVLSAIPTQAATTSSLPPEKKRGSFLGGMRTLGASRSFEVTEPSTTMANDFNGVDITASSSSELPSSQCVTPPRRSNPLGESHANTVVSVRRSPHTPSTPSIFIADESSSTPSKNEKAQQIRSILQQKKDMLIQLLDKKSEQDKMVHRLKKQVIHLKMQIKDESYNAGKEVIQLHAAEQQQKSQSIVLDELVHETLSGVSTLERDFINVNNDFFKRFYRLPEGITQFLLSSTNPSAPLSSDNNSDRNCVEPPSFVYVDPVQVGYLKKSVIDSRMSILRLEKQMLYLKGLCEQVAKSLQEDLQDVLRNKSDMEREYNHQIEQLHKDQLSLHETLAIQLDCKEKDLNVLIHEVMKKKAQNQELRTSVSTCQTEKASLESEIINQISILTKETEDMERRHREQLKEKEKEIKYLQQSMDDMNAQYRESGLVLNYAHIQRLLTMQDSSATFSFSGDDTNSIDKDSNEETVSLIDRGNTPLDLNRIFQCGAADFIVQEKKATISFLDEDDYKRLRGVVEKLTQAKELLSLLPSLPYHLTLIFSMVTKTMSHIVSDETLLKGSNPHFRYERSLGYLREAISNMLTPYHLDESIHKLAAKVMRKDLKAVRQNRTDKRVSFLQYDTFADNALH